MHRQWKKVLAYTAIWTLVVSLLVTPMGKADAETNLHKLGPELLETLEKATDSLGVIVTFHDTEGPDQEELDLLKGLGIEVGTTMKSLPMAGVLATVDQIKALAGSEKVRSIYLNKKLDYYNADASQITGVDKAQEDEPMRINGFPVSGDGVGVVVNDSGIDATHGDLKDNVVQNVAGSTNLNAISGLLPISYTENVPNTDTNSGHGTHVAGTVGGTGAQSGGKYEGAAPGADIIGYGSGAALFVLDSIGGFDYAITHQQKYDIRVITNSWGSSGEFDVNDPVNIASYMAYKRGIAVLFAAGNEGPGENTHNPYAKAPWVISVAAGEKDGTLADFSSRGRKDYTKSFEMDGKTWIWSDRPTITAPGVDIISTRVIAPVSSLAITDDVEMIEPAHLPYYTVMSGTSMATPHAAGIVALMLEADPTLTPDEVKKILQDTATNMPGYEPWEVGAGYVNAYAALDHIFNGHNYGSTLNASKSFNSNVEMDREDVKYEVTYDPTTSISPKPYTFEVPEGVSELSSTIYAKGLLGQTGSPINLVLIAPDGTEYSSGISLLFPLYFDRTVQVTSPMAGTWKAEVRGLRGDEANPLGIALPETVQGTYTLKKSAGFTGLKDIEGDPAASAIKTAVSERLVDGYSDGTYKPGKKLTPAELSKYLVMGAGIRQALDGSGTDPFIQAAVAKGAAIRDASQTQDGVVLNPEGNTVTKAELAYSLVQSLGLQEEAKSSSDGELTVQYKDERIPLTDADQVPAELKGYVQLALDMNILNVTFSVEQGRYDLEPTVKASFEPEKVVTRGDYAVAVSRFYATYLK